jgi:50S ribosomal subunit-associated GTPase HflX
MESRIFTELLELASRTSEWPTRTGYYIGAGKLREIASAMSDAKCCTVLFDVEQSSAQQKNMQLSFNQQDNKCNKDRVRPRGE